MNKNFIRFLIYLFVILLIGSSLTLILWPNYQYDFLISFIINLINTMIGYLVSKKYFNSDNSTFYQMIYGAMFIRFMIILSLMLFLITYEYVNMNPFFLSFVFYYMVQLHTNHQVQVFVLLLHQNYNIVQFFSLLILQKLYDQNPQAEEVH